MFHLQFRLILTFLGVIFFVSVLASQGQDTKDKGEIRDLADMIVTRVNENISTVGGAKLVFEVETRGSVEGMQRLLGKELTPQDHKSFINPQNVRCEYVIDKGKSLSTRRPDSGPESRHLFADGVVTQYASAINHAWIRTEGESTKVFPPVNLWQIGFGEKESFPACVESWEIEEAEIVSGEEADMVVTLVTSIGSAKAVTKFSSGVSFLPIQRTVFHADGSVGSLLKFKYQEAGPEKGWILSRFDRSWYPKDAHRIGRDESEYGWSQRQHVDLVSFELMETVPPSMFSIDLPDGTLVMDRVNNRDFGVGLGKKIPQVKPRASVRWVVGLNFAVAIAVVILVFANRFYRARANSSK